MKHLKKLSLIAGLECDSYCTFSLKLHPQTGQADGYYYSQGTYIGVGASIRVGASICVGLLFEKLIAKDLVRSYLHS